MVFYVIKNSVDYFDVNIIIGEVYVFYDFYLEIRSKREFIRRKRVLDKNFVILIIIVINGVENVMEFIFIVEVFIDIKCAGCVLV